MRVFQLVHQDANKQHLTAEVVMPVMPDVALWPNTYTTVMFDKDPAADEMVKGSEVKGEERKRKKKRKKELKKGRKHMMVPSEICFCATLFDCNFVLTGPRCCLLVSSVAAAKRKDNFDIALQI